MLPTQNQMSIGDPSQHSYFYPSVDDRSPSSNLATVHFVELQEGPIATYS